MIKRYNQQEPAWVAYYSDEDQDFYTAATLRNPHPELAVRLLRARAAQLEAEKFDGAADLAMHCTLLADFMERIDGGYVPIGDPLFNEDGTPWTRESSS